MMVALNAARTAIVETGSLEARWLFDTAEVDEVIADAARHPKMQALMARQEAARLEDEQRSADLAELEAAHRRATLAAALGR